MKRRLAVWLLKQFPVKERREIVLASLEGVLNIHKREFIEGMLPPNMHVHTNPRRKVAA